MTTAKIIKVLLVEDHPLTGNHVYTFLNGFPNIQVVGRAQDGLDAVVQAAELQPTVVVMDVNLPKMDGIAATREIKTRYPEIVVVGLTIRDEDYIIYAMRRAGAFDVVGKENLGTDLYSTIQRAIAAAHPIVILEEAKPSEPVSLDEPSQLPSRASNIDRNTADQS